MIPLVIWKTPANRHFMETAGIEPALCSRRDRAYGQPTGGWEAGREQTPE
jgi:hypothetical protein